MVAAGKTDLTILDTDGLKDSRGGGTATDPRSGDITDRGTRGNDQLLRDLGERGSGIPGLFDDSQPQRLGDQLALAPGVPIEYEGSYNGKPLAAQNFPGNIELSEKLFILTVKEPGKIFAKYYSLGNPAETSRVVLSHDDKTGAFTATSYREGGKDPLIQKFRSDARPAEPAADSMPKPVPDVRPEPTPVVAKSVEEALEALDPDYRDRGDVKKALAIVLSGVQFADEQLDGLMGKLLSIDRDHRISAQELIRRAASAQGQAILAEIRQDPELKFSEFAKDEGALSVLMVVSNLWSSSTIRNAFGECREGLLMLSERTGRSPLAFIGSRPPRGESFVTALVNPDYMSRVRLDSATEVHRRFDSLIGLGSRGGSELIPDSLIRKFQGMSSADLDRLQEFAEYLEQHTIFEVESWQRLYLLHSLMETGKIPGNVVQLLSSNQEVVTFLCDNCDSLSLHEYFFKGRNGLPDDTKLSLTTVVELIQDPGITVEGLKWIQSNTKANVVSELVATSGEADKRKSLLAATRDLIANRGDIESRLTVLNAYSGEVCEALGIDPRAGGRPDDLADLARVGEIDAKTLVAELRKLPTERQFAPFWLDGKIDDVSAYTAERRQRIVTYLQQRAATAEKEKTQDALIAKLAEAFPQLDLGDFSRKERSQFLEKLSVSTEEKLRDPAVREPIEKAIEAIKGLGLPVTLANVAYLVEKPDQIEKIQGNQEYYRYLHRLVSDTSDSLVRHAYFAATLQLAEKLSDSQQSLLGFGASTESDDAVRDSRAYLRALLTLTDGSAVGYTFSEYSLTRERAVVGPIIMSFMESGLMDETSSLAGSNLIGPMITSRGSGVADRPVSEMRSVALQKVHFFETIQTPAFQEFLHLSYEVGLDLIEDTRTLADIVVNFGSSRDERFKESPLYSAYQVFLLDREHGQVFTKLMEMGVKVEASTIKTFGLQEFLTWPELRKAVSNPAVAEFVRDNQDSFLFLLPFDLVTINEEILPLLDGSKPGLPNDYLASDEYQTVRARLRGEGSSSVPQELRYNFYSFRPSMLATLLEYRAGGGDLIEALDKGEELAVRTGFQARPNDATMYLRRGRSPIAERLFSDTAGAVAELDRRIRTVYNGPSASGQYPYRGKEEETRFTRPDLAHMHPTVKVKTSLFLDALKDQEFTRELKLLALRSWGREYPFSVNLGEDGKLSIEVHKNLMSSDKATVSAVEYDTPEVDSAIFDGHTHPSIVNGKLTKYSNVPSGMRRATGDIQVARFARAGLMMSIVNHEELQKYFTSEGIKPEEFLARAEKDPSLLDRVKVNFDVYYLDVPGQRRTNLDLGIH